MKSTIDAMKQLRAALDPDDWIGEITMHAFIDRIIAREEAQTVEPVGVIYEAGGMQLEVEIYGCLPAGTLLFTHQAPATEPANTLASEREALIGECKTYTRGTGTLMAKGLAGRCADMLSADSQEIECMSAMHYAENVAMNAQLVEVPEHLRAWSKTIELATKVGKKSSKR